MSLLHTIEQARARARLSEHKIGRLLANDPRLIADMRRGRRIGPALAARIEQRLAALNTITLHPGSR